MTLPLQTERLVIRRFTYGDLDDIIEFTAHPSVARETTNVPRDDRQKLMDYVDRQNGFALFEAKECVDLAIELKETGHAVGLLSLVSNGNRQGEIGWGLSIDHRGRGLATEAARALITFAFKECGFHRIFVGTIFTNMRSWQLMERLGMRKEAHFVKAHVPAEDGGEWIDTVRYAVLSEEWRGTTPQAAA